MEYIVGVDIGGTFTDCVVVDELGAVTVGKALSTPDDFSTGALGAVANAAHNLGIGGAEALLRSTRLFLHACTVGENTLLTRSGPKTGLLTTRGFADTVLMMRGRVTEGLSESETAHLAAHEKPEPIVPRPLIGEVSERIDYKGAVIVRLERDAAARVVDDLVRKGVTSIAVSLLWSIKNDAHERAVADILAANHPSIFCSLSTDVAPYRGEYERSITTIFNAYIGPTISAYLTSLQSVLEAKGLQRKPLIMQAYGGVLDVEATCKRAIGTVESGPAAGVIGSQFEGELIGERDILAADMGGTTFKVGVIRGGIPDRDHSPVILRHTVLSTKVWVESIGAGGGSIAWLDGESGLLKVGPQGAGSRPGPVCYGLGGTEPTVSDADLVLGYLNEHYFMGGRMTLDKQAAVRAVEKVARPLGMSVGEAASGIYRITNAHMADLLRRATVERGYDPRAFVLFAFGGAGPVHASRYAAELGIRQVVIPVTASVQGAFGLVCSDVVYEYGKSEHVLLPADVRRVNATFAPLVERAVADLRAMGFARQDVVLHRSLDMRYRYQTHELNVPVPAGVAAVADADMAALDTRFDELYEQSYGRGSGYRDAGKEIVAFRLRAIGALRRPRIQGGPPRTSRPDDALKAKRMVFFEEYGDFVPTDTYDFERMQPGLEIRGPAVVETPVTTIVVNPRDSLHMDGLRNIRLLVGG